MDEVQAPITLDELRLARMKDNELRDWAERNPTGDAQEDVVFLIN